MKSFFLLIFLISGLAAHFEGNSQTTGNHRVSNPKVATIIAEINQDSIYQTIVQLCSFGTRSVYADNRRDVAIWTALKFNSLGYPTVAIDSFKIKNKYAPYDSIWEYNVSTEIHGALVPEQIYLLTSHPDTYTLFVDPRLLAPGANDDASGMAGMLEIARVLKKMNFTPAFTIRFSTLSSEEILLEGAQEYVRKAMLHGEDMRLMLSLDCIAYTSSSTFPVSVCQVAGDQSYWTGDLLKDAILTYTTLDPVLGYWIGGNELPFRENGFTTGTIIQTTFSEKIHTVHDSVQYLNMQMCRETTMAYCAALLNENFVPVPLNVSFEPGNDFIRILWQGRNDTSMAGYNVYRSIYFDSGFVKINSSIVTDTAYTDTTTVSGNGYYYRITSVNNDGIESTMSNQVRAYTVTFDRELLVIKDAAGTDFDPADTLVVNFYKGIFQGTGFDFIDASSNFDPGILGRYKMVFWLSSNLILQQSSSAFANNRPEVISYLKNHGKLFLACPQPSCLLASNKFFIKDFSPGDDIYDIFKIKSVKSTNNALLSGASPFLTGYDSLYVDSVKSPFPQFPSHLKNIETFEITTGATVTYLFDTKYDTSTSYGQLKGKPIGLEYLGDQYKVVILSCPLYYFDSLQAHELVEYVITNKFATGPGIGEKGINDPDFVVYQNFPNPVNKQKTVIPFYTAIPAMVSFELVDLSGEKVMGIPARSFKAGRNNIEIDCSRFPGGQYIGILRTGNRKGVVKLMVRGN